ncbi:MAG: hypothetical protein SV429_11065, partial [Pseudomonadota bacterium]|nr:hypothetical protein [Pseudomonadota bacterium]
CVFAMKGNGAAAEGLHLGGHVAVVPHFRPVALVPSADNVCMHHLDAHSLQVQLQMLHTTLVEVTFSPLESIGVENPGEGLVVD